MKGFDDVVDVAISFKDNQIDFGVFVEVLWVNHPQLAFQSRFAELCVLEAMETRGVERVRARRQGRFP